MADLTNASLADYVSSKIDEAIEQGWIKVYYQPVVRAITGEVCGAESLARWIDSEIGFLPPEKFIGVLEESGQIHKLDCYVVRKVCQDIHSLMVQNKPVFPVSVNFSRLDFIMCRMLEEVEAAVKEFDIPRDFIHIEITESMIVSDKVLMTKVIQSFRDAGYEIWMDDFGSGYSSLTLLKDFQFDLLKLDMQFLSSFTAKSKSIVRSTVTMAKDIGIHTLAEGAETKEHVKFLTEIGCGKIQGYYFGKPEPLEELIKHLSEKNMVFEERKWRRFYEIASLNVRDVDSPLELVMYDGQKFKTLFMNKAFRDQIFISANADYDEIDNRIYMKGSPLLAKYHSMAENIKKSGNIETFYFTANGHYLKFVAQVIANYNNCYLVRAEVYDITQQSDAEEANNLDMRLRSITLMYETVQLINIRRGTSEPLLGKYKYIEKDSSIYGDLEVAIEFFTKEFVFPSHRERYTDFMNLETLKSRIEVSGDGHISEAFRFKQKNGTYEWREVSIMMIPATNGDEYLYCLKRLTNGLNFDKLGVDESTVDEVTKEKVYANLWENLLLNCSIKFFWKDKNRRFLGVSQAFLDFYGIKKREDILGKNDEEMHWHVDDGPYKGDELDVLEHGIRVRDAEGQCIVNGVVHNIFCNKMPVYDDDGKITGLVGYFIDAEDELARVSKVEGPTKVDSVTGLMNARSFVDAMISYAMQYQENNRDYGLILLTNDNYMRILNTYGEDISNKVLRRIGERIIAVTGQTCAVARPKDTMFAVMTYVSSEEALKHLADSIRSSVESIREVDGNMVTLRINISARLRSEEGITDELIYQLGMDDLNKNRH